MGESRGPRSGTGSVASEPAPADERLGNRQPAAGWDGMASEDLEVVELKPAASDFVKRDRTARLLGVAYLLYQHPNGLTAHQIAERTGMHVRTVYRDLRALEQEVGVAVWQD